MYYYLMPSLSQAFCHETEQKCFLLGYQKVDDNLVKNNVDRLKWRFFFFPLQSSMGKNGEIIILTIPGSCLL